MFVNNDKELHLANIYTNLNFIHKEQRAEVLNQLIKNCVLSEENGAIIAGPNCKISHETLIYTKKEYQEMRRNSKTNKRPLFKRLTNCFTNHSVEKQVQDTVDYLTKCISTTTIDLGTQTTYIINPFYTAVIQN